MLFNPGGTNLIAVRVNSSQIDSFSVGPDGRLRLFARFRGTAVLCFF